jgi:hypothetical protein
VTPRDVGEMVAKGIEDDAPYVMTHPGVWASMADRLTLLRAACDLRDKA